MNIFVPITANDIRKIAVVPNLGAEDRRVVTISLPVLNALIALAGRAPKTEKAKFIKRFS